MLDDLTIKVSVAGRAIPAHRHRGPVATRACGQRRGGRSLTISYCRGSGVRRTLVIRAQCAPWSRTSAATWTTTPTIQGTSSPSLASATGWRRGRRRESRFPVARRSLRSSVPTRHTTGIERPRCVDRLPSHISKMVVSTVSGCGYISTKQDDRCRRAVQCKRGNRRSRGSTSSHYGLRSSRGRAPSTRGRQIGAGRH